MSSFVPFSPNLTAIQYFTQADPYYYTVDNRPLQNLAACDVELANELDRRTMAVDITGAASPTITQIPAGWTIAVNGTGDYTITHNLGYTNYVPKGNIISTTGGILFIKAMTSTTIEIGTVNLAGVATHLRFSLVLTGY